jgi:hypothetical protein
VDDLHLNESIHIKDIKMDGDIKIIGDPEHVILTISPPSSEEAEAEEGEEAEAEETSEPELIKKGKKEEGGEGENTEE